MFLRVFRLEMSKTYRRPLPWVSLIVITIIIMFISTMLFAFVSRGSIRTFLVWPGSFVNGLNYAIGFATWSSYGTYALIVLVGTVTAQEYAWGTLRLWLSQGISRSLLFWTKCLVALLSALLIVAVCMLSIAALSIIFSFQAHGSLNVQDLDLPQLGLAYLRTTYSLLPYIALTLFVAIVSRSIVASIVVGIAIIAVFESAIGLIAPLLGNTFVRIANFLPSRLATALSYQNYALAHQPIPQDALLPSPPLAALCIALYTLFFFALAFFVLQRQDLAK